jgi:RNA-binding protein YlmH
MKRIGSLDGEDKQLVDRVKDLCCNVKRDYRPYYTAFLNLKQKTLVQNLLQEERDISFSFCGGFLESERVVCAIYPDWLEEVSFPVVLLRILWKGKDMLTHRDFLGAIMNLGVARDRIGDIVITEGGSFLATMQGIAPYLQNNLFTVGRCSVQSVEVGDFCHIQAPKKFMTMWDTIASPRLDCVVGALLNCSRSDAQKLVGGQYVSVDWDTVDGFDFCVQENQVISIRGKGRYQINTIGPQTKKGRLHIEFGKYI